MAEVLAAGSEPRLARSSHHLRAPSTLVVAATGLLGAAGAIAGSVALLGAPVLGDAALFALAFALAVVAVALLAGPDTGIAGRPANPPAAEAGELAGSVELSRHLETVLDALLDLRSDNARLREELTASMRAAERSNRLASVGVVTAGLVHEMRNPLVALKAFAQLLPERWSEEDFRREFSDVVLSELDRIGGLMNELLLFARNTNVSFADTTVGDVLVGVVPVLRAHAARKQIAIEIGGEAGALPIVGHVAQLRQVVMNLALNALEATPRGGQVRIVTGLDTAAPPRVVLQVIDTGPGIDPEHASRIFDPFFTTRDDGTGLGLAISREIVERHGGSLLVESAPGGGATFTIALPSAVSAPAA